MDELQQFVDRISSVGAVITTYDTQNPVILAANKRHEQISGYKNTIVVGQSPRIFQNHVSPTKSEKEELKNALTTGDFWEGTLTNYKPDSTPYEVHIIIMGVIVSGQRYYLAIKTNVQTSQN